MNARRRQQAGSDVQLCIAGEARADRSSVAADPGDGGRDSERDVDGICEAVCGCGASVDCSGAAVAGAAPADFLFGAERTAADGTAAVQLAVSLVCGDGDGRGGVEPRGVQQESGAAAERGRSEEHTSELQSRLHLVCRLLLEKKKKKKRKESVL